MNDSPTIRPTSRLDRIWSWMGRWRKLFFLSGSSCLIFSMGLATVSHFTAPRYLFESIQVWEWPLGPSGGVSGGVEKAYKLDIKRPAEMYLEDDQSIVVSLTEVSKSHRNDPNARVHITLTSQSFKFNPEKGLSLPLRDGERAEFSATATAVGKRSIRIVDQFWVTEEPSVRENPFPASALNAYPSRMPDGTDVRTISLEVRERPLFMVFDRGMAKDLQILAAIIGIPGLIIFFLSAWRDRRGKDQKPPDGPGNRPIRPPSDYRNRRKIEP